MTSEFSITPEYTLVRKQYIVELPYNGSIQNTVSVIRNESTKEVKQWADYSHDKELGRNLTLSEYLAQPHLLDRDLKVIEECEFSQFEDEYSQSLITGFSEISKETYWWRLECLPPCKWTKINGVEMFHISERIRGDLVTWCFEYQDKYYTCDNEANKSRNELAQELKQAIEKNQVTTI